MIKHLLFSVLFLLSSFSIFGNNAITQTKAFQAKEELWQAFRKKFPHHIQTIALSEQMSDGSWVLLISEPPTHVDSANFVQFFKKQKVFIDTKVHRIGVDGWTKDLVVILPKIDTKEVHQSLLYLHRRLFHTTYKADFLNLSKIDNVVTRTSEPFNYKISILELRQWLFSDKETFQTMSNSALSASELSLRSIFKKSVYGVFSSKSKGLIIWTLPQEQSLFGFKAEIRQFSLESDAILGAISDGNSVAIIGKARTTSIYALPPMRTETVLDLAATEGDFLYQSYERHHPLAGKMSDKRDWAPIALSKELLNTEMGSLLNITDQMLKSWSEGGNIAYYGFEDYPKPLSFMPPVRKAMGIKSVIYNWNMQAATVLARLNEGKDAFDFLALNSSSSLPNRYIPVNTTENVSDIRRQVEQRGLTYFSELNDPCLIKVVSYASLFQIFKTFKIHAERLEIPATNQLGRDYLIQKNHELIKHFRPLTTADRNAIAKRVVNKMIPNFSEIVAIVQETQPNVLPEDCFKIYQKIEKDSFLKLQKRVQSLTSSKVEASQLMKELLADNDSRSQKYDTQINETKLVLDKIQAALKPIAKFGEIGFARLDTLLVERLELPETHTDKLTKRDNQINVITPIANLLRDSIVMSNYASTILNEPLEVVCKTYQRMNDNLHSIWLKTPSVVISLHNDKDSLFSVGGHSLNVSNVKFIVVKDLSAGKIGLIEDAFLISEADVAKITPDLVNKIQTRLTTLSKTCNRALLTDEQYSSLIEKEVAACLEQTPAKASIATRTREEVLPPSVSKGGFEPNNNILGEVLSDVRIVNMTETEDILFIAKTEDNTCESIIDDIVAHVENNTKPDIQIRFKNVSQEQAQSILKAVEIKTARKMSMLESVKDFSTHLYDFSKQTMRTIQVEKTIEADKKDILISIPLRQTPSVKTRLTIRNVAKSFVEESKKVLNALFDNAKSGNKFNFVESLKKDLEKSGVKYSKIELELEDCVVCQLKTVSSYDRFCEITNNSPQSLLTSDCITDDRK